jgi:NADH:ubiquinone oxidoreductase subunit E
MNAQKTNGRGVIETVDLVVDEFHAKKEELIPMLMKINQTIGFIPNEAFDRLSTRIRVPKSQIYSVATFYHMISTKPVGRHVIKFCESAPCHVSGGFEVWKTVLNELGIQPGDTSEDGKWTLMTTSCLGVCAVGPVMMVDDDIYGNLTPDQVPGILGKYE